MSDALTYSPGAVAELRAILAQHQGLYNPIGGTNSADPFLISVAKELNAVVVTDE